ncbi:MAG: membrane protein insertion efficiency factor YidD [Alphaproteobacteria bacterium]|nr:MAG: membrane protein insertion efficiency factor YidD [Alphaproteobacteria bacterium]
MPHRVAKLLLRAPILLYRYSLSAFMGRECRYLPTCSEYAEEAIDRNGPWRGLWLVLARLSRCHPWGDSGFDPVPDITGERHPLAPWRYGRWRMMRPQAGLTEAEQGRHKRTQ